MIQPLATSTRLAIRETLIADEAECCRSQPDPFYL